MRTVFDSPKCLQRYFELGQIITEVRDLLKGMLFARLLQLHVTFEMTWDFWLRMLPVMLNTPLCNMQFQHTDPYLNGPEYGER